MSAALICGPSRSRLTRVCAMVCSVEPRRICLDTTIRACCELVLTIELSYDVTNIRNFGKWRKILRDRPRPSLTCVAVLQTAVFQMTLCAQGAEGSERSQQGRQHNRSFANTTRRGLCIGGMLASAAGPATSFELAEVTPVITPPAPLRATEQALIDVFEASTRSVVNIFDLSLQGRSPQAQVVRANHQPCGSWHQQRAKLCQSCTASL
jgi:hypothetical protein